MSKIINQYNSEKTTDLDNTDSYFYSICYSRAKHTIQKTIPILPVLSAAEEKKYIDMLNTDSRNYAIEKLVSHNILYIFSVCKKYRNIYYDFDEILSSACFGLVKGAKTYNPEKNVKFLSYVGTCIRNEILQLAPINAKNNMTYSIEKEQSQSDEQNDLVLANILEDPNVNFVEDYEKQYDMNCLIKTIETLKEQDKFVLLHKFGVFNKKKMTQQEIAKCLGVSQSYISRLEKEIIKKVHKNMEMFYKEQIFF